MSYNPDYAPENYPAPPPSYNPPPGPPPPPGASSSSKKHNPSDPSTEPLLGGNPQTSFDSPPPKPNAGGSGGGPGFGFGGNRGYYDIEGEQQEENDDDVPEDFKIGVTVSESSKAIRRAFVRKVYGVLCMQLIGTTIIGGVMCTEKVSTWVIHHQWSFYVPLVLALITLFILFFKRQSHPLNIILLSLFTTFEAIGLGAVVSLFNKTVVVQALVITCLVFAGLTAFTFWSKWDFGKLGQYLFGALLVFLVTGLVGIFWPFSRILDAVYSGIGCLIFCGYILFDTWMISNRLSPDDWVLACIELYLDVINLFINILRLLSDIQDN